MSGPTPTLPVHPLVRDAWDSTSVTMPRQLAVPSGLAHLVIRFSGPPITLSERETPGRHVGLGHGVAVAVRSTAWIRHGGTRTGSVGVTLAPWGIGAVLGIPPAELGGRHAALVDVLGAEGRRLIERIGSASEDRRLPALLTWVTARLALARIHPVIPAAVALLEAQVPVAEVVRRSGLSHRRFIELFVRHVGVRPAELRRVVRVHRAIGLLGAGEPLADIAVRCGYADQAHLTRDVSAVTGDTPGTLRRRGPYLPGHVPLPSA